MSFRMATLNVGGRNTNPFEFVMSGDYTPLAARWTGLYERALVALKNRGPASMDGLQEAILEARRLLESDMNIEFESWEAMLDHYAHTQQQDLFTALNVKTLALDRPSVLENPASICDGWNKAPFALWFEWVQKVDRTGWQALCAKKNVRLEDCLLALFVFDSCCYDVVTYMFQERMLPGGPPPSQSAMIEDLVSFSQCLPFTTEAGKMYAFSAWLKAFGYPDAMALQEATPLIQAKSQRTSPIHASIIEHYAIFHSGETALLVARSVFANAQLLDDTTETGSKILTRLRAAAQDYSGKTRHEWDAGIEKTVAVKADSFVIVSYHGKSNGTITLPYLVKLRDIIVSEVADCDAVVIGMDSNSADEAFATQLEQNGFDHKTNPRTKTVCKKRTPLQPQVHKTFKLDQTHKDFVVVSSKVAAIRSTLHFPELNDSEACYLPSVAWPFDHSVVAAEVVSGTTADHTLVKQLGELALVKLHVDTCTITLRRAENDRLIASWSYPSSSSSSSGDGAFVLALPLATGKDDVVAAVHLTKTTDFSQDDKAAAKQFFALLESYFRWAVLYDVL